MKEVKLSNYQFCLLLANLFIIGSFLSQDFINKLFCIILAVMWFIGSKK